MTTALAEKIAPASPASWLEENFIQDAAFNGSEVLKAMHVVYIKWRDAALLRKRQLDPAHVVNQLRETARKLYALANEIEGKMR